MKKIFSFILLGLMCSIGNLWAVDPDVSVTSMTESTASTYFKTYSNATFLEVGDYQKVGDYYNVKLDQTNNSAYVGVTSSYTIDSVAFLVTGNGKNKKINAGLIGFETIPTGTIPFTATDYATNYPQTASIPSANYSDAIWITYDLHNESLKAVYLAKQWKNVKVGSASAASFPSGNAQSFYVYGIKVWTTSPTYSITYNLNGGTGEAPTQANLKADKTFTIASANGITPPANKEFDHWNDGTNNYNPGDIYTMGSADVTLTAQWRNATVKSAIIYANLNGADNSANPTEYSEGIGIASFEPITRDGYVFAGWTPSSISASATGAQTITANWLEAVDKIIYSWESDGTATEIGGTATAKGDDAAIVNKAMGIYYTLQLNGNADYSSKHIQIDLNAPMNAGDKIAITAFYWNNDDKNTNVKIADGSKNVIWTSATPAKITTDGVGTPDLQEHIASANVPTSTILLTRGATQTSSYITHLLITRTVGLISKAYNGVKVDGVTTDVTKEGNTITLNSSYVSAPNVALVEHQEYNDDTNADIEIEVENFEVAGNFFVGTATVANILYTVKVPKVASYIVTYMDGEETLGTENVVANGHPANFADYQYKSLYSFVGWYNNADLADEHRVTIASEVITAAATYYGKWEKVYASSINFEQLVLDNGKSYNILSQLGALGYATNMTNNLDSLNDEKTKRNEPYLGQKAKAEGTLLNFRVDAGQTVKVKFGNIGTTPQVSINTEAYADMTITAGVYTYVANEEVTISIKTVDGNTVVFKQIMIDEDIKDVILPSSDTRVTLSMNGWASYAANFAYSVSGATVYKAAYNGSDAVVLTEVVDAVVPANQGIILKGEEGATVTITPSDETASDFSGNGLIGVVAPIAATEGMYVLSTNAGVTAFNPCQVGLEIPAHKAYISIPSNAPAVRIIFAENGATGINELEGAEKAVKFIENGKLYIQKDGVVYDATGAKVK